MSNALKMTFQNEFQRCQSEKVKSDLNLKTHSPISTRQDQRYLTTNIGLPVDYFDVAGLS